MEKSMASAIIRAVLELGDALNRLDAQLRDVPDDNERRTLLSALGRIIAELDSGLIRPLAREYPELDPDS
jgi:hypothetical protein